MVERGGLRVPRARRAAGTAPPSGRRCSTATRPGAVHVVQELFVGLDARAALPGMLALVHNDAPGPDRARDDRVRLVRRGRALQRAGGRRRPASRRGDRHRRRAARDRRARARASSARSASTRRSVTLSPFGESDPTSPASGIRRASASTVAVYVSFGSEIRSPGAVPLHRARARRRPEAGADDDRPPRRPGRAGPAAGERPRRALGRPGRGHAARRGDGRPWRLGRDAGGARRRRPASRSCRSSSTVPPTPRGSPRSAPGSSRPTSAGRSASCSATRSYRAAAERVAGEIRALPPVERCGGVVQS